MGSSIRIETTSSRDGGGTPIECREGSSLGRKGLDDEAVAIVP